MAITDFIEALNAARDALAMVTAKIGQVEAERRAIERRPPHSEDIVAALMRGVDAAGSSFESRLKWHLNDRNATDPAVSWSAVQAPHGA